MSSECSRSADPCSADPPTGAEERAAVAGLRHLRGLMGAAWPEMAVRLMADLFAERPALAEAAAASPALLCRTGHVLAALGGTAGDERLLHAARGLQAGAEAGAADLPARAAAVLLALDSLIARIEGDGGGLR